MVDGIIIRDLSVYYETLEALSMVNLDIRPGRLTILLGPNGAGKTTLINAVSGLLHDRMQRAFLNDDRLGLTGRIICDGEDITNFPPHERIRRGVIHCPEKRRPFPEMNVLDNLLIGAYLRKDRQAVKQDLERAFALFPALKRWKNKEAGFLSGGEQQMLALGRAFMSRPRFLLMDEPMTGLAPIVRALMKDVIFGLFETGEVGILITEQNSKAFLEPGADIYIMGRGVVVFEGTAEDVIADDYLSTTYFGQ